MEGRKDGDVVRTWKECLRRRDNTWKPIVLPFCFRSLAQSEFSSFLRNQFSLLLAMERAPDRINTVIYRQTNRGRDGLRKESGRRDELQGNRKNKQTIEREVHLHFLPPSLIRRPVALFDRIIIVKRSRSIKTNKGTFLFLPSPAQFCDFQSLEREAVLVIVF